MDQCAGRLWRESQSAAVICCARIAEVGHGAAFPMLLRSSHSLNLVHQRIQEERQEARHGSVTDCGANGRAFQDCVRFKSLEDLALDVVGRTVARVSAEEHMANYQAARALMGKGNSELRNSSRARRVRERGSSASALSPTLRSRACEAEPPLSRRRDNARIVAGVRSALRYLHQQTAVSDAPRARGIRDHGVLRRYPRQ